MLDKQAAHAGNTVLSPTTTTSVSQLDIPLEEQDKLVCYLFSYGAYLLPQVEHLPEERGAMGASSYFDICPRQIRCYWGGWEGLPRDEIADPSVKWRGATHNDITQRLEYVSIRLC